LLFPIPLSSKTSRPAVTVVVAVEAMEAEQTVADPTADWVVRRTRMEVKAATAAAVAVAVR